MAYIGKTPTPAPLTSSDITNGIVTGEKLNADVISSQTELATAPADTDEFLISDAGVLKRLDASLVGGGKVLQVVSATDSTVRSTTSTSYVTSSNTLSVNITPSSTSSKILLTLDTPVYSNTGGSGKTYVTIFKGGSDLNSANSYGLGALGVYTPANTGGYIYGVVGISHINSPSTTSSVTYDVRFRVEASSFTGYINQSGDGAGISTLTAIEIGA